MARIDVKTETDSPRGWTFAVAVYDDAQPPTEYQVVLSWVDYDHWSHGRVPPERVAAAAVRFVLDQEDGHGLGHRFDCARLRRLWPEIDRLMPGML